MSIIRSINLASQDQGHLLLEISSKNPVLIPSAYKANLDQHLRGGYVVKIKKGTKQITLLRNLLAGVLYQPGGGSIEDFLVIFEVLERCSEKTLSDTQFAEKYSEWLITVQNVLVEWQVKSFPFIPRNTKKYEEILRPFLPSRQAYFGWVNNPARGTSVSIVLRSQLSPPKIKPKRFIGVGYKDKGSRRNPAKDGSPSWQEVTMDRRYQEETSTMNSKEIAVKVLRTMQSKPQRLVKVKKE